MAKVKCSRQVTLAALLLLCSAFCHTAAAARSRHLVQLADSDWLGQYSRPVGTNPPGIICEDTDAVCFGFVSCRASYIAQRCPCRCGNAGPGSGSGGGGGGGGGCPCTRDYRPVCGTDGRTYPNKCVANNCGNGVDIAYNGPCNSSGGGSGGSSGGGCACNLMYAPVCGVDGKTYGNSCMANNCGRGVGVAYKGPCRG